jgi:hypothetical protein
MFALIRFCFLPRFKLHKLLLMPILIITVLLSTPKSCLSNSAVHMRDSKNGKIAIERLLWRICPEPDGKEQLVPSQLKGL